MDRILISGASGPIGSALRASFERENVHVVRLVRGAPKNTHEMQWNPMGPVPAAMVSGFDAVVHLSGETVMGRWTEAKKTAIRVSRVTSTKNLATALAKTDRTPSVLVCASAIGFYGDHGDEILNEDSLSGPGFLPEICREWEQASRIAADVGIRTVNVRIGLVLSPKGGALSAMLTPFKLGVGGRIGSGKQWWSWIHVDDIIGGIRHAIGNESVSGPINLVGPNAVRNAEFTKVLSSVLRRPAIFPVPEFAVRLAFGTQAANEMMLASQRVVPARLEASGYAFRYGELGTALENLVRQP